MSTPIRLYYIPQVCNRVTVVSVAGGNEVLIIGSIIIRLSMSDYNESLLVCCANYACGW